MFDGWNSAISAKCAADMRVRILQSRIIHFDAVYVIQRLYHAVYRAEGQATFWHENLTTNRRPDDPGCIADRISRSGDTGK